MRRFFLAFPAIVFLAFFAANAVAGVFYSDCRTLSMTLPAGWKPARQKLLPKSTLEVTSGKSRLALYPFFGITGQAELGRQLQSDRKLVLDNLQQPSGVGRLVSGSAVYYYFAWSSSGGMNTMGYLNAGGRFYHLVLKDVAAFSQVKTLLAGVTVLPVPPDPAFTGPVVNSGPRDTALLLSLNRREYPQAETVSKVLSLTRYNGAMVSVSEETADDEAGFSALCAQTEIRKKAVSRSTGTLANGWEYCKTVYSELGGELADYYFRAGGLIYMAQAGNVPDEAVLRLLSTGKTTSIMAGANSGIRGQDAAAGGTAFKLPPEGNPAQRPLASLPPLPKRALGAQIKLIFAVIGFTVLSFLLRLVLPAPENPPFSVDPNSPYPLRVARRYLAFHAVYEAADAQDRQYTAVSPRFTELATGLSAFVFIAAMAARTAFDLTGSPDAALAGRIGAASFVVAVGFLALSIVVPKRMFLYDENMKLLACAVMRPMFLFGKTFVVYDPQGRQVALIIRSMFRLTRHWYIADLNGEGRYEMSETSALKAGFRKMFGHLCGML
ncbi:MAG: hypothetical protein PHW69_09945, partial [Elusimicrobiaceae bacterium]|nr:hypothetical protein [Elusimicrobiaceae bacterium]